MHAKQVNNSVFSPQRTQVVDARVGPGIKSMTKFKKRKEEQQGGSPQSTTDGATIIVPSTKQSSNAVSERFEKIFKKTKKKKGIMTRQKIRIANSPGSSDGNSSPSSSLSNHSDNDDIMDSLDKNDFEHRELSPFNTAMELEDFTDVQPQVQQSTRRYHRKANRPLKNRNALKAIPFVFDQEFWVLIKTCCGYAYENQTIGALIIDENDVLTPCPKHSPQAQIKMEEPLSLTNNSRTYLKDNANTNGTYQPTNSYISMAATANLPSKKLHLLKSQGLLNPPNNSEPIISRNSQPHDNSTITCNKMISNDVSNETNGSRAYNYSHKIKSDSGRIVKQSLDRNTAPKPKVNDVKNLIKFCTDKSANGKKNSSNGKAGSMVGNGSAAGNGTANDGKQKLAGAKENKIIEAIVGNKFNDNSSDSGYEETLHDTAQVSIENLISLNKCIQCLTWDVIKKI